MEFLNVVKRYDQTLKDHLEDENAIFKGTSKTIQNDLILGIGNGISTTIQEEIKEAPFIGIQADKATDISSRAQLSVIIRYVDKTGIVQIRFHGIFVFPDHVMQKPQCK